MFSPLEMPIQLNYELLLRQIGYWCVKEANVCLIDSETGVVTIRLPGRSRRVIDVDLLREGNAAQQIEQAKEALDSLRAALRVRGWQSRMASHRDRPNMRTTYTASLVTEDLELNQLKNLEKRPSRVEALLEVYLLALDRLAARSQVVKEVDEPDTDENFP